MALAATAKADPVVLGAAGDGPDRAAGGRRGRHGRRAPHDATMLGERLAVHRFCVHLSSAYVGWERTVSVSRVLAEGRDGVRVGPWSSAARAVSPRWSSTPTGWPGRPAPLLTDGQTTTCSSRASRPPARTTSTLGLPSSVWRRRSSRGGSRGRCAWWYDGPNGPASDMAVRTSARCSHLRLLSPWRVRCGPPSGSAWNVVPADGRVVALGYGCGAHSETDVPAPRLIPVPEPLVDELSVEPLLAAPLFLRQPRQKRGRRLLQVGDTPLPRRRYPSPISLTTTPAAAVHGHHHRSPPCQAGTSRQATPWRRLRPAPTAETMSVLAWSDLEVSTGPE